MKAAVVAITCVLLFGGRCNAQSEPLKLNILQNGHVRFDDGPELDARGLRAKIKGLMREKPRPEIRVLPDRMARYDAVAKVLNTFQQLGYGPRFGFTGISN